MKRIILMAAVLGLAAPALAEDRPVALDDAALDQVSGGGESLAPALTLNVNASPIILVQNATAVTTQWANTGAGVQGTSPGNSAYGHEQGQGKGCKKKTYGTSGSFSSGAITQAATTTAFNVATINYSVVQK